MISSLQCVRFALSTTHRFTVTGLLSACLLLSLPATLHAQTGQWTWMSGSSASKQYGVYGSLKTPAATALPGSRNSGSTWSDAQGHLWLFGGYGFGESAEGDLNDLWEFDTATNQWAWMGGQKSVDQKGVYGTLGTAAATNLPGGRSDSMTWKDANGKIWLFGGYGYGTSKAGCHNDLWLFDPATNLWTWMGGSSTAVDLPGNYGTLGTAAKSNIPTSRMGGTTWTDSNGLLWLLGGWNFTSECSDGICVLNDLWSFNPTTRLWTWMGGSDTWDPSGDYGSLGVTTATNTPPGRYNSAAWLDQSKKLWLFGGGIFSGGSQLNDLWKYNLTNHEWTWMGGSNTPDQSGNYGTQSVADSGNIPGSRLGASYWTDASGYFWLYGGSGHDAGTHSGGLSDLWKFNPKTNQWTWVSGSSGVDQDPSYGTLRKSASTNQPGVRTWAMSWRDSSGNLWLFGGEGNIVSGIDNRPNDLWKYQLASATNSTTATPTFSLAAGTYTASQSLTITDTTANASIYYTLDGSTPSSASTKYTSALTIAKTTTVKAIAIASGYTASNVASATFTITLPLASTPTFAPVAGRYGEAQTITLASASTGATIYYTTDGTTPSAASTKYTAPIAVTNNATIHAIAVMAGKTNSATATAVYTFSGSPEALTGLASTLTTTSATLNALANNANLTGKIWFVWGTSATALTSSTSQANLPASANRQAVSVALSGLKSKTTYYFRPIVSTTGGTGYGAIQSFKTN